METWREQRGPSIPEPPATPGLVRGSALVQAIDGAPGDGRPLIYRTLVAAIMLARKSVHLTTGFFAPTPDLAHVLKDAVRRGTDVEIIVPAHSDSSMAIEAGRARYEDLLEAGVKIYERQGVVLHAKTAVIDGVWAAVGSSNLDWRSVLWNNEIDAVILDQPFGARMEVMFQDDVAASRPINLQTWNARPLAERLQELEASLIESLL